MRSVEHGCRPTGGNQAATSAHAASGFMRLIHRHADFYTKIGGVIHDRRGFRQNFVTNRRHRGTRGAPPEPAERRRQERTGDTKRFGGGDPGGAALGRTPEQVALAEPLGAFGPPVAPGRPAQNRRCCLIVSPSRENSRSWSPSSTSTEGKERRTMRITGSR
jgi:hypothetical protein